MTSADAHAILAADDPALPALPDLLDATLLGDRLGAPTSRSYLRYKPGTSAIALVDVAGRSAIAQAWRPGSGDKRAKALKHAGPEDVLLDAPEDGLLVLDALADRHLPALRLLVRSGRAADWLTGAGHAVPPDAVPETLAHKPARRWVGRLPLLAQGPDMIGRDMIAGGVVLRAYTGRGHAAAVAAHGLIDPSRCDSLRLPTVLATHRRGLIALEHLPGRALDASVSAAAMHRLGACLGELHTSGPTGEATAAHPGTMKGIAALAPVLGDALGDAEEIHAAARAALRPGARSVIHGDFSLDQVIAHGHDLGVIDLDRVRLGNPLDDLASLLAEAAITTLPSHGAGGAADLVDSLRAPFVTGHAATWSGALSDDLGPRIALELLARGSEPFRAGDAEWPRVTRELIGLAGSFAATRGAAA